MKYLLSFLFGAAAGAFGTLLWLRKDIKEELEARSKASESDDMPFTMGEGKDTGNGSEALRDENKGIRSDDNVPLASRETTKVEYNRIINSVKTGEKELLRIPVLPREDYLEAHFEDDISQEEKKANFVNEDTSIIPIDYETFKHEKNNNQEQYVYFRGDRIMATEDGTVITNPALMVGSDWENYVGAYKPNSAYIRNNKMNTDYEIFVEDGLYEDEYGPPD